MENAKERCERMLAEHSKTLPRVFGDPLRQGIGKPDRRLADESPGHIAAYTLGFLQELAARVQQYCEDGFDSVRSEFEDGVWLRGRAPRIRGRKKIAEAIKSQADGERVGRES